MELPYRPCVLAVFTNDRNQLLVGERAHNPGQWQFPQGGIDEGETPEQALYREVEEELGCREFDILGRGLEIVRYRFPQGLTTKIAQKWSGQDQVWFLTRFREGYTADLSKARDVEFKALAWVSPREALERIVDFKRDAYLRGLDLLGLMGDGNMARKRI